MNEAIRGNLDVDNEWLELIMHARSIGLTIEEVRTFLQQSDANYRAIQTNQGRTPATDQNNPDE